jgi:hypothetical protein
MLYQNNMRAGKLSTFLCRKMAESEAGIDDWGFETCGYVFGVNILEAGRFGMRGRSGRCDQFWNYAFNNFFVVN